MSAGERRGNRANSDAETRASELQQAAGRLEDAVQDVLRGAKEDFAGKAAGLIDDTTRRLQGETRGRHRRHRRARYSPEPRLGDNPVRTARLYRSVVNRRVGGVCSGFANYFGVEAWVARCIAVTGLLFLPGITMPAYWIAYFMLDDDPDQASARSVKHQGRRAKRRAAREAQRQAANSTEAYAPHRALRHLTADLTATELRLRRMEGHVTSDQYELRKQLHALDS